MTHDPKLAASLRAALAPYTFRGRYGAAINEAILAAVLATLDAWLAEQRARPNPEAP